MFDRWTNPLDLYRELKEGRCDEATYVQKLEEIQRRLSREVTPVAADSPLNPPQIPTVVPFKNVIVPAFAAGKQGVLLLREDATVIYDTFTCGASDAEDNGQHNISNMPLEVWANDTFASYVHPGTRVVFPGAKKWELKNNSASAHNVIVYLSSGGVDVRDGLRPSLLYGVSTSSSDIYRPVQVSSNTERMLVSLGNQAGDANGGNTDLWLSSQETNERRGSFSAIAAGTYTICAAVASTTLVCLALKLQYAGAPVGDIITAAWKFSGGTEFWRQVIDTSISNWNTETVFGVTGPAGNAGSSLQVTIAHPGGGADGWIVQALCRYITGV